MPEQKRPLQPADLLSVRLPGDPQISPDGAGIAYVLQSMDRERNEYHSAIWLAAPGSAPRPFTFPGEKRDAAPRWRPDGQELAFVSNRSGKSQVWAIPTHGGEARQVTRLKHGVGGTLAWSPDGRYIAFTASLPPEGIQPEGKDEEEQDLLRKYTRDVRRITRMDYKEDGTGFKDEKRRHLCVVEAATGAARQLTAGEWDHGAPAWSPDGRRLALVANRAPEPDYAWGAQVWAVDVAAWLSDPAAPAPALAPLLPRPMLAQGPAWSPDGATIAFLGNDQPGRPRNTRLWTVAADGSGRAHCVTAALDVTFDNACIGDLVPPGSLPLRWAAGGESLLAVASLHGSAQLLEADVATGRARQLTTGPRAVYSISFDAAGTRCALGVATSADPGDIYVAPLPEPGVPAVAGALGPDAGAGLPEERLTAANAELLAQVHVALPQPFTFSAPGGPEVSGWVVAPAGAEPGRRYPAVVEVHGGPMAQYTPAYLFEFQLLSAAGYAVVFTNPRGSLGYGEEFVGCIHQDWGNLDYQDVMAGVAAACREFPFIDPDRLGIAGGSYGGFMTNWAIGHTDRFKAAVTMRSVVDMFADIGTCDCGYADVLFGGSPRPWENPEYYFRQSPITYAGNINTPLLIEAQEEDHRCPMHHQEELFIALKLQRKPVEFHRYPGESHGMSREGKPWHRVHRLMQILAWFDRYLKA